MTPATTGVVARSVFPVMGTVSSIIVPDTEGAALGPRAVDDAIAAARAELDLLERRFSHYRVDSEINRWIAGHDVAPEAVRDIERVLRQCEQLRVDSDGVFQARDPRTDRLDTAGYVKGYAIGRAAQVLRERGLESFALGVGGDACFAGRPAPDRSWQVAVQDPDRRFGVAAMIPVIDGAVATSGTAERGEHIWGIAPQRGPVASFTVTGPDIALADAYATIGFAMGEPGMSWVASHVGYRSVVVRTDGSVVSDAALVSVE